VYIINLLDCTQGCVYNIILIIIEIIIYLMFHY